MAFDFKKEYKEFYMPKNTPAILTVPKANYIAVRGKGNPNEEGGAYQQAISALYAVAYTLRMSYKTDHKIEGFFEYVVPPLEGFWWQENIHGVNYADKDSFNWISVIRLPDFVNQKEYWVRLLYPMVIMFRHETAATPLHRRNPAARPECLGGRRVALYLAAGHLQAGQAAGGRTGYCHL